MCALCAVHVENLFPVPVGQSVRVLRLMFEITARYVGPPPLPLPLPHPDHSSAILVLSLSFNALTNDNNMNNVCGNGDNCLFEICSLASK